MFSDCEFRKLSNNMTSWENKTIKEIIHNNKFRFNTYSMNRLREREIKESDLLRTINQGNIVEFHYKNGSCRVLLRCNSSVKSDNVCIVLDLNSKLIITAYKNCATDSHRSLDYGNYMNGVNLKRYLNLLH